MKNEESLETRIEMMELVIAALNKEIADLKAKQTVIHEHHYYHHNQYYTWPTYVAPSIPVYPTYPNITCKIGSHDCNTVSDGGAVNLTGSYTVGCTTKN